MKQGLRIYSCGHAFNNPLHVDVVGRSGRMKSLESYWPDGAAVFPLFVEDGTVCEGELGASAVARGGETSEAGARSVIDIKIKNPVVYTICNS